MDNPALSVDDEAPVRNDDDVDHARNPTEEMNKENLEKVETAPAVIIPTEENHVKEKVLDF